MHVFALEYQPIEPAYELFGGPTSSFVQAAQESKMLSYNAEAEGNDA